jgi:hypothetical protein
LLFTKSDTRLQSDMCHLVMNRHVPRRKIRFNDELEFDSQSRILMRLSAAYHLECILITELRKVPCAYLIVNYNSEPKTCLIDGSFYEQSLLVDWEIFLIYVRNQCRLVIDRISFFLENTCWFECPINLTELFFQEHRCSFVQIKDDITS